LISPSHAGLVLLSVLATLRWLLNRLVCIRLHITKRPPLWLIFLRECACFAIWFCCYMGRRVKWRDADITVAPGGGMKDNERSRLGVPGEAIA
jgi:hypothetical protein